MLCAAIPTAAQDAETPVPNAETLSADTAKTSALNADEIRSLLRTVNFEFNSAALVKTSHKPLDSAAVLFKQDSGLRYEVQGHTDCKGNPNYNKRLSMARAISVKNYLITAGVPGKNIVAIGYGAEVPVADNKTDEGRAANRRVEVVSIECHDTYNAMRETEASLLEEVRQADIKGFEELPHDIVAIPEHEPEPELTKDVVIEDKPADTAPDTAEVITEPKPAVDVQPAAALVPVHSSGRQFNYLFSFRPELLIVFGEISSIGAVFELGLIDKSGLLLSLDFGGGLHYYGVGLNLGYSFTAANNAIAVFGLSGNYHYTDLVVYFNDRNGVNIARECGVNKSYAGVFWKIIPRKSGNLDITNRILFGYKRDSAWYDREKHEVYKKDMSTVTYSVTVGAALVKRSKNPK